MAILMFGPVMVLAVIMAVIAKIFEPVADALPSHENYQETISKPAARR